MTTLQEYLNQKYPTKEDKEKVEIITAVSDNRNLEIRFIKNWELEDGTLQEAFRKVENIMAIPKNLDLSWHNLSLSDYPNVEEIKLDDYKLTSVDFLNTLPNPEKLKELIIHGNNIKPTDIEIFSRFINLECLMIGTNNWELKNNKYNYFYGSLKSYRNLTKLKSVCIEATDVDRGLEHLSIGLASQIKNKQSYYKNYDFIQCSPHNTNAKCSVIQNQLRPFNYDLEAWQLAHPHKMYKARPEIFFDPELKTKWLSALRDKTNKTQEKLNETRKSEPQAVKRIKRLEMKLDNLKLIQQSISKDALIDKLQEKELVKKENKYTQTETIEITK